MIKKLQPNKPENRLTLAQSKIIWVSQGKKSLWFFSALRDFPLECLYYSSSTKFRWLQNFKFSEVTAFNGDIVRKKNRSRKELSIEKSVVNGIRTACTYMHVCVIKKRKEDQNK